MRISLVAPLVARLGAAQIGGAQTALCELAGGLVRSGDEVELYAPRGSRVPGVPLRIVTEAPFGTALHAFVAAPRSAGQPDLRRNSRPRADQEDWPSLQAPAFLSIASAARARRPAVVNNHALDWPAFYALAATGLPVVHTLHLGPVDPAAVAAATAAASSRPRPIFVTGSRACAVQWRPHLRVDAVIPFGIDPQEVPFGERPEPDLAIIAGRISPEKGTHLALAAARRAGMRVVVAGPVYDERYHREQVEPRLHREGTVWLGAITRRRLTSLYGRAAVALVASRWEEPFGLVALEANLAGTPVAGFARGGLPEVVGATGGVLSGEETVDGLARAIAAALRLDRRRVRRGAVVRHSATQMVERYRRLYRSVAAAG